MTQIIVGAIGLMLFVTGAGMLLGIGFWLLPRPSQSPPAARRPTARQPDKTLPI